MAQDPEQLPMRPALNGHSERIIPEQPQQQEPMESEQIYSPDPHYSYGAYAAPPQSQEISTPPAQPSYDSPEFYTLPQLPSTDTTQVQPIQQPSYQQQAYAEQSPYGTSPQQYGTPPSLSSNSSYGATSGYGHGTPQRYDGYNGQYGNNGSRRFDFDAEAQSSPLPLGAAIRGLFAQYGQVIAHPSPKLFAREMGKAKWNIVWAQMIGYALIVAVFSLISAIGFDANAAVNATVAGADTTGLSSSTVILLKHILVYVYNLSIYGQVLITPLTILIGASILYLLAKAFGGTGKYVTQLYCSLLFLVPLGVISSFLTLLLSYLPAAGSTLAFLITIAKLVFECVLLGYLLIPVHRITAGRATGAVLLLCGVIVLLACVFGFAFAAILAAAVA